MFFLNSIAVFAHILSFLAICSCSICDFSSSAAPCESTMSNKAISASNEFSMDLFKLLAAENSNLFFSPVSISIALAMTFLGCKEETATQLAKAMHWDELKDEELHDNMAKFFDVLSKVNNENNTVTLANRFWVQKDFSILESYIEALSLFYKSTPQEADFATKAEEVRQEINKWVDEKTKGKITDLIASGILSSLTRMVLVNAIYFKGIWKKEFDEKVSYEENFYVTKDDSKEVMMMSLKGKFHFGFNKELDAQILQLPYTQDQLSMIIILPQELDGLAQVEQKLTMEMLQSLVKKMRQREVEVTIPRFKMTSQFELTKVLPKLGVLDLFDGRQADMSGVTGGKDLYVSNVIHKAFVEVNEKGTEAAAATAVVANYRMAAPTPSFYANHPFLFFIQEKSTGAILFLGRLQDPLA